MKNSSRVDAIADGSYVDFQNEKDAKDYLDQILQKNLLNKLMTMESELVKKFQSGSAERLAEQILLAPDQFYAAALLEQNEMYFGRGDFTRVLN